jgi:UDP-N-acetyl-D-glucosamine dehydrogenase
LSEQDAILIATDHSNVDYTAIVQSSQLVIDTRNVTQGIAAVNNNIRRC